MSETQSPIEIDIIIYLGGLDVEGISFVRRKGYRIGKIIKTLALDHEIFIIEEDSEAYPRIVVEIVVSYDGLSEAEKFKTRGIANRFRRQILERLNRDTKTEAKVILKELP